MITASRRPPDAATARISPLAAFGAGATRTAPHARRWGGGRRGAGRRRTHEAADHDLLDEVKAFVAADPAAKEERNKVRTPPPPLHPPLTLSPKDGWTPIMTAAFNGSGGALRWLLAEGADINAVCDDGDTADYAPAQGHVDMIEILAEAGCDLTIKDHDGETPTAVAQDKATAAAVKMWIKRQKKAAEKAAEGAEGAESGAGRGCGGRRCRGAEHRRQLTRAHPHM